MLTSNHASITRFSSARWALSSLTLTLVLGAAHAQSPNKDNAKPPMPPVFVTTATIEARDQAVLLQAQGIVLSAKSVDVKPQASGLITALHVQEGQTVRKGQLLVSLDNRTEIANLARAQAQLLKDQAALADAQRQLARAQQLHSQGFVSQGAIDTATTQVQSWQATLALDQANIDAAEVALSNTRVLAPQAGRVGQLPLQVGSAVQINQTTLMTLTQLDPIDVQFSVPQRYLPDLMSAAKGDGAPVEVGLLEGGTVTQGRLRFVDSAVDAATGAIRVKATVPNPQMTLWPGAAVQVKQTLRTLKGATVVPTEAVVQGQRGAALILNVDGVAVRKPIKVVQIDGAQTVVTGVQAGDKVVVDGKQNARPGAKLMERKPGEGKPAEGKPTASAEKQS